MHTCIYGRVFFRSRNTFVPSFDQKGAQPRMLRIYPTKLLLILQQEREGKPLRMKGGLQIPQCEETRPLHTDSKTNIGVNILNLCLV